MAGGERLENRTETQCSAEALPQPASTFPAQYRLLAPPSCVAQPHGSSLPHTRCAPHHGVFAPALTSRSFPPSRPLRCHEYFCKPRNPSIPFFTVRTFALVAQKPSWVKPGALTGVPAVTAAVLLTVYHVLVSFEKKAFDVKNALDEAVEKIFLFKFYCLDPRAHIALIHHVVRWEVRRRLFRSVLKGRSWLQKKHLSELQVELAGFRTRHYFYLNGRKPWVLKGFSKVFQWCVLLCVSAGQQTAPLFTHFLMLC